MNTVKIVFFGSFQAYSAQILDKLTHHYEIIGVVTTPARPSGRHLVLTPTEVEKYARTHQLPVYPLESLESIPRELPRPDFLVVAGYGKLIPTIWLTFPTVMPVNIHQSLLPNYRGAFPAEWAILRGEKETGITIVKMSPEFDKGEILVQKSLPIAPIDTRETLYQKLYELGGELIVDLLPKIKAGKIKPRPQPQGNFFYARKITRDDGFIPWPEFTQALKTDPQLLERKFRALAGWPGIWTTSPDGKRLKLIRLTPEPLVQLEGKNPVSFSQFSQAYLK